MEKIRIRKEGFTLVELIVVLAVMALLASLIVGAIMVARKTATVTGLKSDAKKIQESLEAYYSKKRTYPNPGSNRMDAYELYDTTPSVPLTIASNPVPATNHPFKDELHLNPPYPTPPAADGSKGIICYTYAAPAVLPNIYPKSADYYLWYLTADDIANGKWCGKGCSDAAKCGFPAASPGGKVHCPKDVTWNGCEAKYQF